MTKSDFNIQEVAQLSRIKVDQKQEDELKASIKSVLNFVNQIKDADVPDIEPNDFFRLTKNRLRQDTDPIDAGRYHENILRVAPNREGDYIKVKKIIDQSNA